VIDLPGLLKPTLAEAGIDIAAMRRADGDLGVQ
jgi:hypothetical protein